MVERDETDSREREIVRKGIERLEIQLMHFTKSEIVEEPLHIPLIKKCKTVDVPSVHAAVGHIQKALQRFVKFPGIDAEYCDYINDLMDIAENWCLNVEGDTNDVGVFLDNAKVTIYKFLNSIEIAYIGWGNSIQRTNRLYNRHLSEEIKSKLINKFDEAEVNPAVWLSLENH